MFDKFLNWIKGDTDVAEEPNIRFGRYSDAFKSEEQYRHWNKAVEVFDQKNSLEAYESFFHYLRDKKEDNVDFEVNREKKCISFKIIQGSKIVTGTATDQKVVAEADIARYKNLSVAFMRKLMEMNYGLQYGRFALHDDVICIKFDTSVIDGAPEKIYFALKEIATRADKQDDLLVNEFKGMLTEINTEHTTDVPDDEKRLKINYLRKWLDRDLERVKGMDVNQFAGGLAYTLLNLAYKIDYLLSPEGTLMHKLEDIHKNYFLSTANVVEKIAIMQRKFKALCKMPDSEIEAQLYHTKATFGVNQPALPAQIYQVIKSESERMLWYRDNKQEDIALNILEYIAQYCLFYFGMPHPMRSLFEMIIRMINADYFQDLGFKETYFDPKTKTFNKKAIKNRLNLIEKEAKKRYPKFKFNQSKLEYSSLVNFVYSMFLEIPNLDYNKQ